MANVGLHLAPGMCLVCSWAKLVGRLIFHKSFGTRNSCDDTFIYRKIASMFAVNAIGCSLNLNFFPRRLLCNKSCPARRFFSATLPCIWLPRCLRIWPLCGLMTRWCGTYDCLSRLFSSSFFHLTFELSRSAITYSKCLRIIVWETRLPLVFNPTNTFADMPRNNRTN